MIILALLPAFLVACQPAPDTARDTVAVVPTDSATGTATETVLITEIMAENRSVLEDGDGDSSDWVELYNPGPDTVALEGWGLSDDPEDPWKSVLPERDLLPGEYLLVYCSGKGSLGPASEIHTPFRLSSDGEDVVLVEPDGALSHALSFPAQREDISWGLAQTVSSTDLLGVGSDARLSLKEATGWTAEDFDDSAWEAAVLGIGFDADEGGLENTALFQPTEQSSDGYGYTGEQAVDGELSTFSHTGDDDLEPWWQVDLEDTVRVASITLHNREDCCQERLYNITVELLDEVGEPLWVSETLNPVTAEETPTDPGDLAVTPDTEARYVRVSKTAFDGSEWLSFAEVEVQGQTVSPYADAIGTDLEETLWESSASAWLRVPFTPQEAPDRLALSVRYDDGFSAWLEESLAVEAPVDGAHDGSEAVFWALDPVGSASGLLALRGDNVEADDPDFLLAPTLTAQEIETGGEAWFDPPTPGSPNEEGFAGYLEEPSFKPERGFFDAPFTLEISAPDATVVYTLDGSAPSLENGEQAQEEVVLDLETTSVVRAAAFRDGWADSDVATHTYLFLEDVVEQPAHPEGFPTTWDGVDQSAVDADYEMDPEIVEDPAYTEDLLTGLRAIGTLSVVLDPEDLFGEEDGIYVHSLQRGSDWERPASVEYLLPDGSTGFQEDCGVRIHGYGWRYHSNTLKHALRLEFRSEYGPRKLDYPLFPDAPVERFDSIVLRSQGSRSWQDFRDPEQAQYIRDAFARDTALEMGKEGGHAIFVHLYLNGLYWGLYNPVERPDADFAAERFGGDDEEYDAINRRTTTNEAIDGDLEAYETLLALADADLSVDANYEAVQQYLDVDDLIDYMLIHQYTTNRDGPCCYSHNNMRGVRRREEGAGFRFFVWDMEYSLWEADDSYNIDIDVEGSISHVYARLRDNAEFRRRYSERAAERLYEGGALTADACIERWERRATEIEDAIVAESARWGDTDRETPYTRDEEWAEERRRLTEEYFPNRTAHLVESLKEADLLQE